MRISTNSLYESGLAGILRLQQEQVRLQQQVSTGRRLLAPSDDPVAAAAVLEISQSRSRQAQYATNIENARAVLLLEEQALGDATRLLQDIKVLTVSAGNPALRNEELASLAAELQGRHEEFLGIANRTDGSGGFLFSGYHGNTRPFAQTASGSVIYHGDEGQRLVQIGDARQIATGNSGSAVFQSVREGNGSFVPGAAAGNTGAGVVDGGVVTNALSWSDPANPRAFEIRFHVDSGVTPPVATYDIVDTVNNLSMLTGAAPAAGPHLRVHVPGAAIVLKTQPGDSNPTPFDFGAEVTITGAPADGDGFSIRAAGKRDIFGVMDGLADTLRDGHDGSAAGAAAYRNRLNAAMTEIDNALDHVLTIRAASGIRLAELDGAQAAAETAQFNHDQNLSRLQDLDYARAISDIAQRQIQLEAAQKSFVQITNLRLFDFI
ncbi:MAG: flagellar hook-associated protein FlgL [Burkholderiales bacterium]